LNLSAFEWFAHSCCSVKLTCIEMCPAPHRRALPLHAHPVRFFLRQDFQSASGHREICSACQPSLCITGPTMGKVMASFIRTAYLELSLTPRGRERGAGEREREREREREIHRCHPPRGDAMHPLQSTEYLPMLCCSYLCSLIMLKLFFTWVAGKWALWLMWLLLPLNYIGLPHKRPITAFNSRVGTCNHHMSMLSECHKPNLPTHTAVGQCVCAWRVTSIGCFLWRHPVAVAMLLHLGLAVFGS
jgi:hypothetical protein